MLSFSQAFPFASLLDLSLPLDLVGYPCFEAEELLCVHHGSGHSESCQAQVIRRAGTSVLSFCLAGGPRRVGSGPPTLQQSKGKGTSLTMLGGSLQESCCTGSSWHPQAQPLLSVLSEGQRSSTQHRRKLSPHLEQINSPPAESAPLMATGAAITSTHLPSSTEEMPAHNTEEVVSPHASHCVCLANMGTAE